MGRSTVLRIMRDRQNYLTRTLGAYSTDLTLLANFSIPLDHARFGTICIGETPGHQFCERLPPCGGAPPLAVDPMRLSANEFRAGENWQKGALGFRNLSELLLALGNISEAAEAALCAVELADRSGDLGWHHYSRATLGDARHQQGWLADARRLFADAEEIQTKEQPDVPVLKTCRGSVL